MSSREVLTSFNLRETDLYFLVGKALKSSFSLPQSSLFFEVPVGSSRADIVHVQTPGHAESVLGAGLHMFEVKMRWDCDRQRLRKQLKDYSKAADYVWVVGVNMSPRSSDGYSGELIFSTNGCQMDVQRIAMHNGERIDIEARNALLSGLAGELRRRSRLVDEMAWVNRAGERRILVQEKLECA